MLPAPKFILYLTKDSKTHKMQCFFIKHWVRLFLPAQLFFPLNNTKKKLYANVPEMFNFNPKISIQKYPISNRWYNFFSANVSDFYRHFTAKNKSFESSYLCKNISYTSTF